MRKSESAHHKNPVFYVKQGYGCAGTPKAGISKNRNKYPHDQAIEARAQL